MTISIREFAKQYDAAMNAAERVPMGDDYNALYSAVMHVPAKVRDRHDFTALEMEAALCAWESMLDSRLPNGWEADGAEVLPPRAGFFGSDPTGSGLCDIPDTAYTITGHFAGLGVLDPEVQRHAVLGPLLGSVLARHQRVCTIGLGIGSGHQRRWATIRAPSAPRWW